MCIESKGRSVRHTIHMGGIFMNTRKLLALTLAAAMLPAAGCRREVRTGATLALDLDTSYVSQAFDDQGVVLAPTFAVGGGLVCMRFVRNTNELHLFWYAPDTGAFTELEATPTRPAAAGMRPDGKLCLAYNVSVGRRNGMDLADGKQRAIRTYDLTDGTWEDVPFPDDIPTQELLRANFRMDGDGEWLLSAEDSDGFSQIFVLTPDLDIKGTLAVEGSVYANDLVRGASGTLYAEMVAGEGMGRQFYRVDTDAMTCTPLETPLPADAILVPGTGAHELYYNLGHDALYYLDADGTTGKVIDYHNSSFVEEVYEVYPVGTERFVINYSDRQSNPYHLLRPRTEAELRDTTFVSLAGVDLDPLLIEAVCRSNREDPSVQILLKDYADPYREPGGKGGYTTDDVDYYFYGYPRMTLWPEAIEDLKNDLLNGTVPDIICMDGLPARLLSNKGLLTDLWPLLEADERFDASLYQTNILEALKTGDRLEEIGFGFTISTTVGKRDLVGAKQGRDPAAYLDLLEEYRDKGVDAFAGMDREHAVQVFLVGCQSSFIDRETMTCHFDDPAFVRLLELTAGVATADELWNDERDFRAAIDRAYVEDRALLRPVNYGEPRQYHRTHGGDFAYEDITLVGYPDPVGGNGGRFRMKYTLALTAQSARVDEVMTFLTDQLGTRCQAKLAVVDWDDRRNCFPLMTETLHNALDGATRGGAVPSDNANDQEMAVLRNYIDGMRMYDESDSFITAIITEEAERYFAGDTSAEDAAAMIQSRAAIYLSEQK